MKGAHKNREIVLDRETKGAYLKKEELASLYLKNPNPSTKTLSKYQINIAKIPPFPT